MDDIRRRLLSEVEYALESFRVVIVNGPRQGGKSTLLGQVAGEYRSSTYVSLDDRVVLRTARSDPEGFVAGFPKPLLIDEVQRGGDPLVIAVKAAVDRDRARGQFVLAGSTRFLMVPTLSESLAGRAVLLDLWPLSMGELLGQPDGLVDRAFDAPDTLGDVEVEALDRRQVADLVVTGGFPDVALRSAGRARRQWFDSYLTTMFQRDVSDIASLRRGTELPAMARLVAGRTANELAVAPLAGDLGLAHDTARTYLSLLETVYFHQVVPVFSRSVATRQKHRPKVHVVDSGVAAHLLDVGVDQLARPTDERLGPLLETFVAGEVRKQLSWAPDRPALAHLRDADGREVDLVLEGRDGRIVAIEVKAAVSIDDHDSRHLRWLRDKLGDHFVQGIVLHLGDRPCPLGDRITALPVSALWTTPAP